jgi:HlyD family secretion protein
MRRRILLTSAALLTGTIALTAFYARGRAAEPELTTAVVARGDVVQSVKATGTLEAVTTVQVGSQVSGTIASLEADFNSQVKKGQVVARLEPSLLQAQVDQARANLLKLQSDAERARVALEDAKVQQRRAETLSSQQLLPASELESARVATAQADAAFKSAQAQISQSRAALGQAEVNLSHTTITAPIDGIVISRSVDIGQTVAASMQAPVLFTIAQDLRHMQVNASVDEADIGKIAPTQLVTFQVDAYPGKTFAGSVRQVRLAPVVDQNVVSYVTVIDVPNPELHLKPGMTANVAITIARADDVLKVPNAALRYRPDAATLAAHGQAATPAQSGNAPRAERATGARSAGERNSGERSSAERTPTRRRVWVLNGETLTSVRVETGVDDGTTTAIVGGELAEGARIVTGAAQAAAATTQPSSASPLMPQRPRGTGRGGAR